jgi:hypothetical protein
MPVSGFIEHVSDFAQRIRDSLPGLTNRGKLKEPLNADRHGSFIYSLPNPTTAAWPFDPLKRGLNNLNPQPFYGLNSRLIIWAPKIYFNHLGEAAAVRCPLCDRIAHVLGWGKHLRRVCGLEGTFYLIGTRYACKDCPGELRLTSLAIARRMLQVLHTQL